ncbi:MAG TPA: malto-oligosyltrehalose synthase, partial [Pseudoxanthomonas sp.]|nr:malto-oligosyltrehalose synthase [Pseudoxanthomonas sp.]
LFADGAHLPLPVHGPAAAHAVAFARRWRGRSLVVVVPRHVGAWLADRAAPRIDAAHWRDTALTVPRARYRDLFGGQVPGTARRLPLGALLQGVPVAVLVPD